MTSWQEDLFAEKTLFDVFRIARKFEPSRFNAAVMAGLLAVLSTFLFINVVYDFSVWSVDQMISGIDQATKLGFSFSSGILGFLITGFAIFASVTNK